MARLLCALGFPFRGSVAAGPHLFCRQQVLLKQIRFPQFVESSLGLLSKFHPVNRPGMIVIIELAHFVKIREGSGDFQEPVNRFRINDRLEGNPGLDSIGVGQSQGVDTVRRQGGPGFPFPADLRIVMGQGDAPGIAGIKAQQVLIPEEAPGPALGQDGDREIMSHEYFQGPASQLLSLFHRLIGIAGETQENFPGVARQSAPSTSRPARMPGRGLM